MSKKNLDKNVFAVGFSIFMAAFLALAFLAGAQEAGPKFLISWRASSYAPADFSGKILPTAGSQIVISFDVVSGGKIIDLSAQMVYWYANDNLFTKGVGLQTISITAPANLPNSINIRIEVPGYSGGSILQTIEIPVVRPEAVIESPYPNGKFFGPQIKVSGAPYFFNTADINNLSFFWSANGKPQETSENPTEFTVSLNPDLAYGSAVKIGLLITNTRNQSELASAEAQLTFSK